MTQPTNDSIIKLIKKVMKDGEISFIDFIINNQDKIKELDNQRLNKPLHSYGPRYYNNEIKNSNKSIIHDVKKNTLFHFFNINSWSELVDVVILNNKMRQIFKPCEYPSFDIFKIIVQSFKNIYNENVSQTMLHFLTSAPDNYLIYILAQWIKESKVPYFHYYNILSGKEAKLFENLMNEDSEDYIKSLEDIQFSKLECNESWAITHYPIYYNKSKIYTLFSSYDGMGWYKVLSISFLEKNKNHPFVFCLDGGSSGIDRQNNYDYFQNNQPSRNKMLTYDEMIEHIKNNSADNVIFKLE
jgi:hypothetical protein